MHAFLRPFAVFIPGLALALLAFAPAQIRATEFGDRLVNLSTRAQVGTGANVLISGFVVGDGAPKKILLRPIGPTLGAFAVTGTLGDPVLSLYDAKGGLLLTNSGWAANDSATISSGGAFALPAVIATQRSSPLSRPAPTWRR